MRYGIRTSVHDELEAAKLRIEKLEAALLVVGQRCGFGACPGALRAWELGIGTHRNTLQDSGNMWGLGAQLDSPDDGGSEHG